MSNAKHFSYHQLVQSWPTTVPAPKYSAPWVAYLLHHWPLLLVLLSNKQTNWYLILNYDFLGYLSTYLTFILVGFFFFLIFRDYKKKPTTTNNQKKKKNKKTNKKTNKKKHTFIASIIACCTNKIFNKDNSSQN